MIWLLLLWGRAAPELGPNRAGGGRGPVSHQLQMLMPSQEDVPVHAFFWDGLGPCFTENCMDMLYVGYPIPDDSQPNSPKADPSHPHPT